MRRSLRRSPAPLRASLIVTLAVAIVALTPVPARADVCLTIDEAHDTFSPSERSAALLLLKQQFELEHERVVDPGCEQTYVISHVKFGTRIIITLSGPKGRREATAMGMDDVPAVYSQMVRSLLRGEPMEAAGVVDRTNVSNEQAGPQNRRRADSVWYARLGYGMYFADQAYAGPTVGFLGFRREGVRYGIDASFLNFQYKASNRTYNYNYPLPQGSSGMTGTWVKLEILRYFSPAADRSPYIGAGLSLSATNLNHDNTSWDGTGLQGELTGGFEMGRAGSIHVFFQADAGLPFYKLRSTTYTYTNAAPYYQTNVAHRYVPTLTVSLGLGWQRGGGK